MADEPNGKRPIITRETLVPWGAAVAFAGLSWLGATKYSDLEKMIIDRSNALREKSSEESREVALQIQALKFTVEAQGRDLAQVKISVDTLTKQGK
jgi:flagellar biosynthesis regulator FlaF